MRPSSPRVLLALWLLSASSIARAQPAPCQPALRRIELAEGSASPVEICISPGLSTTVLFDRVLATNSVVVEGRERFKRVEVAGSLLVLVPSEQLQPGERLGLKVGFEEAATTGSASFVLVVHRGQADRQVEVSHPRGVSGTCQAALQRKEEELQRCLEQRGPLPTGRQRPAGLVELLLNGAMDSTGVSVHWLNREELSSASEDALDATHVVLYRSAARIVLELRVKNSDRVRPWVLEGAALVGRPGEVQEALTVIQEAPLAASTLESVWVEFALPAQKRGRAYTLQLWDAGKARSLTLHGLKVP